MPQIPKRCPTVANMGCSPPWLERGTPNGFEWEDVRRGLGVGAIGEIVYAALGPSVAARPRVESVLEGIAGVLRRTDRNVLAEQFDGRVIEYLSSRPGRPSP